MCWVREYMRNLCTFLLNIAVIQKLLRKSLLKTQDNSKERISGGYADLYSPEPKKNSTIILCITNQILPNSKAQTSYGQNCFLFLYVSCTFIQHQEIICQNTAHFRNIYIYIYSLICITV